MEEQITARNHLLKLLKGGRELGLLLSIECCMLSNVYPGSVDIPRGSIQIHPHL